MRVPAVTNGVLVNFHYFEKVRTISNCNIILLNPFENLKIEKVYITSTYYKIVYIYIYIYIYYKIVYKILCININIVKVY